MKKLPVSENSKKANIKDVAKEAGVAVSTVSRVLNDRSDVNEETREHVLKVMNQLNYVPNNSARNLKRNTSNAIGVFVQGILSPFTTEIFLEIEHEFAQKNYETYVYVDHKCTNSLGRAVEFVKEKKLLGLVFLAGVVPENGDEYLKEIDIPVAFVSTTIDPGVDRSLYSSVNSDEKGSVDKLISYLIGLGHKRIGAIITEEPGPSVSKLRFKLFLDVLKKHNIEFDERMKGVGYYLVHSGHEAMTELLKRDTGITAVFAVTDQMAIGAVKAVFDYGLRVPEDISVVGFDGLDYGQFYNPSLTTIKQPGLLLGKTTGKVLIDKIENGSETEHIIMDTNLVVGGSCKSLKE